MIAVKIRFPKNEGTLVTFKISPLTVRKAFLCLLKEWFLFPRRSGKVSDTRTTLGMPKDLLIFCVGEQNRKSLETRVAKSQWASTVIMVSMGTVETSQCKIKLYLFFLWKSGIQNRINHKGTNINSPLAASVCVCLFIHS